MIPFWWDSGQHHQEVMASIRKNRKQKEKPFTRDDQWNVKSSKQKRKKQLGEKNNNCVVIITEEQLYDCFLRPIIYK